MALNINIDVSDPSGLLNSNRIQVAANRSAQQEKETKRAIEKKATPLREENLEEQSSPYSSKKRLETKAPSPKIEEPTANILGKAELLLVPNAGYVSPSVGIPVRVRYVPGLTPPNTVYFRRGISPSQGWEYEYDFIYKTNGGPANSPYLEAEDVPTGSFGTALTSINEASLDPDTDPNIAFGRFLGNLPASMVNYPPYQIEPPVKRSAKVGSFKNFTVEAYFRLGKGYPLTEHISNSGIEISFPGCEFNIGVGGDTGYGVMGNATLFLTGVKTSTATVGYNPLSFNGQWLRVDYFDPQYVSNFGLPNNATLLPTNIGNGLWHHFAIVKDSSFLYFFFDGQLRCQVQSQDYYDFVHSSSSLILRKNIPFQFSIRSSTSNGAPGVSSIGPNAFQGLRLSHKALYRQSFVPPNSILNFK